MPSITLIFAAAAALVNLWLGLRIGRLRTTLKVSHGDGGNPLIARRMRAQLNFAESAPVVLILFLALELSGANPTFLWICATLFVIGRLAHGLGMDAAKPGPARMVGILLSMLITLTLAGYGAYLGYRHLQAMRAPTPMVGTPV